MFEGIKLKRERMRRQIAEEIAARNAAEALDRIVSESVPRFVRDNDEDEWGSALSDREPLGYGENDLDQMLATALSLSFRPGGRGLLDTMESFVIGEGCKVIAEDENPEVQKYWDGWCKANKWDMRQKEAFRRFLRDGEVFLRWFKPAKPAEDGKEYYTVRFVEPNEIRDPANTNNWGHWSFGVETDPEDVEIPVAYFRNFKYIPSGQPAAQDKWERIPAEEIDHFRCLVDSNVKRGRSWLLGVAKYIVMHENWLEMRYQLNRMRNLFAVIGNMKGPSSTGAAGLKSKFTDATGKTDTNTGVAPKKMPSNAMMLIQSGIDWQLQPMNINASDAAEDGRNFQLMIAAGTGMAEYVVRGDASNANFSSTMVAESPMVKMFQKYQDIWRNIQQVIYRRVIRWAIDHEELETTSWKTQEGQKKLRQIKNAIALGRHDLVESILTETVEPKDQKDKEQKDQDPKGQKDQEPKQEPVIPKPEPRKDKVPTNIECQVEFPPLIHRDIVAETSALTMHQANKWASRETCAATMGYDYEKEQEKISGEDTTEKVAAKQADESWS